jgi:hypothetical protein
VGDLRASSVKLLFSGGRLEAGLWMLAAHFLGGVALIFTSVGNLDLQHAKTVTAQTALT